MKQLLEDKVEILIIIALALVATIITDTIADRYYGAHRAEFADYARYGFTLLEANILNFLFVAALGVLVFELSGKRLLIAAIAIFGFGTSLILQMNLYKEALAILITLFALWRFKGLAIASLPFFLLFWSSGPFLGIAAAFSKLFENHIERLPLRMIFSLCFCLTLTIMLFIVMLHHERMRFWVYGLENLAGWLMLYFLPLVLLVNFSKKLNQQFLILGILSLLGACAYLLFFFRAEVDFWRIMVLFEYSSLLAISRKD